VPRLFVAVRPPAAVLDRLHALERADQPGVRWVPPAQWHVTLRFLGEADLDAAVAAVRGLGAHLDDVDRPVAVELGPRVSRLGRSVVCLPAHGLDALAAAVAAATAGIGEPPDPRPYAGHLTLARLRGRAACGIAGEPFSARFEVGEVELVRSTLASTGATHEVVATAAT
jgi:2'-5' RNA ligase